MLENFAESMDVNSFLDLSKYFFVSRCCRGVLTDSHEVTLRAMTVFAMLELLRSWKLALAEPSAVLSLLEQKGEKRRGKFDSNLYGMHPEPC